MYSSKFVKLQKVSPFRIAQQPLNAGIYHSTKKAVKIVRNFYQVEVLIVEE